MNTSIRAWSQDSLIRTSLSRNAVPAARRGHTSEHAPPLGGGTGRRGRPADRFGDVKLGGSPAMSRVMVIISLTDNAGNHWARGARGELRQLSTPAIEYWKVHKEDIDWRAPTRLD
jgi:hypothetical protein